MSENYLGIMMRIMTQFLISHGKVEIYRDTGVSKNNECYDNCDY